VRPKPIRSSRVGEERTDTLGHRRYAVPTVVKPDGTGPVTITDHNAVVIGVIMDNQYEMVVCQSGKLKLRDPDDPHCWIATDSPVELEQ